MPKRKDAEAPASLAAPPESPLTADEERTADTIEGVLLDLPPEASVKIYKRNPANRIWKYCRTTAIDETTDLEDLVGGLYGGGDYKLMFSGFFDGRRRHYTTRYFSIEGRDRVPSEEPEGGVTTSTVSPVMGDSLNLALQVARLTGLVEGMKQASGGMAALDPISTIEKLSTVMVNMRPAGGSGNPSEMLGFMKEALGFVKELAPDGDREPDPLGKFLEHGVEPLLTTIKEGMAQQKALAALPPVTVAAVPEQPVAPVVEGPMWTQEVAAWVPRLVSRAKAAKDPELAADVFMEDVSDETARQLEALAARPEFVEAALGMLQQFHPDVVSVRPWFEQFLKTIQEMLTEGDRATDAEAPATPEAAGDAGAAGELH